MVCGRFDPHQQRVTRAAITENKHLSAVLAHIKDEQDKAAPPPKVKPVSAKNGYKKTGHRPPVRPSNVPIGDTSAWFQQMWRTTF